MENIDKLKNRIDYYGESLKSNKRDLELMEMGVIAKVGSIIVDYVEPVTDDKLTLTDVCKIADTLNFLLEAIHDKQRLVDSYEADLKKLNEQLRDSEEGASNDT